MKPLLLVMLCLLAVFACSKSTPPTYTNSIEQEVLDFMKVYANALNKGDREKIASFYSQKGTYTIFNGNRITNTYQQTQNAYRETWQAPSSFQWCNVSVIVISEDAAQVLANFDWEMNERVTPFSYTGLLIRENGELKIRLEDETIRDKMSNTCALP